MRVRDCVCVRASARTRTQHTRTTHINFSIRCNIMQWHRHAVLVFKKTVKCTFFSLRVIKLRLRRIQPETRERGVFALLCIFIHSIRCVAWRAYSKSVFLFLYSQCVSSSYLKFNIKSSCCLSLFLYVIIFEMRRAMRNPIKCKKSRPNRTMSKSKKTNRINAWSSFTRRHGAPSICGSIKVIRWDAVVSYVA